MKIKPKENYSIDGYGKLNKAKTYKAVMATTQPDYQKEGKIFVEPNEDLRIELLLTRKEYEIVN